MDFSFDFHASSQWKLVDMELILKNLRTMSVMEITILESMTVVDILAMIREKTMDPDQLFLSGEELAAPMSLLHLKTGNTLDVNRTLSEQGVTSGDSVGVTRELQLMVDLGMQFGGVDKVCMLSFQPVADLLTRLDELGRMPSVRMATIRIFKRDEESKLSLDQSFDEQGITDGTCLRVEMEHAGTESFLHFLSDMGTIHRIADVVVTIGRSDLKGRYKPDIDLRHEDNGETVSRDHGQLIFRDQNWLYEENPEGTTNGTYASSVQRKLITGEVLKLQKGDRIRIGQVWLTFTY